MIKFILVFIVHTAFLQVHGNIEEDKFKHLVNSATVSSLAYMYVRSDWESQEMSWVKAFLFTSTLSVLKEMSDDNFDANDVYYDVFGAAIAPTMFISLK